MLDTRLQGRDMQLEDEDSIGTNAPDRTLLGAEQYDWLIDELSNSTAKWKVLGNQVVFSPLNTLGLIANNDAWDGYPAERERIYNHIVDEQIDNIVVITGDIHVGIAADVTIKPDTLNYNPENGDGAIAVEFVAASVSSNNIDEINAADPDFLSEVALNLNIHGKFANLADHGYFILDLTDERAQGDWYWMEDIRSINSGETQDQSWYTIEGENFLQQAESASLPAEGAAPLAEWPDILGGNPVANLTSSDPVILSSYPNPFSQMHQLSFVLEQSQDLSIALMDLSGKRVMNIHQGETAAGVFNLKIDGNQLPTGVYLLVIDNGKTKVNRKIVVGR